MDELVLYEKEGAVGKVVLNKPQHGNTLDLNTLESLIGAFRQSDENEDLCVLYTAEGNEQRFFHPWICPANRADGLGAADIHQRRVANGIRLAKESAEGITQTRKVFDIGFRRITDNVSLAAKELTILPGRTVTVRDAGPYGAIMVQGHGTMGVWSIEAPALIRFGQLTYDEFFVSHTAAQAGVTIHNPSRSDPIVMLKHFGPNPEAPAV